MAAKAENINGLFTGKAIIDADTETVKVYSDVPEWKSKNNITQPSQLVTWPKYTLGGKIYHSSRTSGRHYVKDGCYRGLRRRFAVRISK